MNQRLTHFDVRLQKDDYVRTYWNAENRNVYLLRPEIEWPLSIDPLVWPSVFFSKPIAPGDRYGSIEVDWGAGDCWLDLEHMRTHYEAHKLAGARGVFVAVQLFSEQSLDEDVIFYTLRGGTQCGFDLGRTVPNELPPRSEFLGYDVADAGWISGLTDCGYTAEEKQRLTPVWQSRLNPFGLLTTLEDAIEFRHLCDQRVPEHAPFWVYGISRLPLGG